MKEDWSRLEALDHWWGWLPGPPVPTLRAALEGHLADQVEGARVEWVEVTADPTVLTGGVPATGEPSRVTVRRAAVAVPFTLSVILPSGERHALSGVFSWAAGGLDSPGRRRDRTWLDLGMSAPEAGLALDRRINQV